MMTLIGLLLLAAIVLVALYRKDSVTFCLQFLGARVHLEAKGKGK